MTNIRKILIYLSLSTFAGGLLINSIFKHYDNGLPNIIEIIEYEPKSISRVYDRNDLLLGVFYDEKREFTPISKIPNIVKFAFISAEDKNFYQHSGYDIFGLIKALVSSLKGQKLRGASTITQQVTKGFLLSGERSFERKIKELILAVRLEKALSKDEILEIYLNEVFLGEGTYGVSAAAKTYFSKQLKELLPREAAFLAALPKSPKAYNPKYNKKNARFRRNFVLNEMAENGYLDEIEVNSEINSSLETVQSGELPIGDHLEVFEGFFADDIRTEIIKLFGKRFFDQGGLSIKTTIDRDLQEIVTKTLENELESLDFFAKKYRQPINHIESVSNKNTQDFLELLQNEKSSKLKSNWEKAVVIRANENNIFVRTNRFFEEGKLHFKSENMPTLNVGDIIYVEDISKKEILVPTFYYKQRPFFDGGLIVLDLITGNVLALEGGYDHKFNELNKITEAKKPRLELLIPVLLASVINNSLDNNLETFNKNLNKKIDFSENALLIPFLTDYNLEKFERLLEVKRLIFNSEIEIEPLLFNPITLNLFTILDLVRKNTDEKKGITINNESSIFDIISTYNILINNKRRTRANLLLEIYNRNEKIFPYINESESCLGCKKNEWPNIKINLTNPANGSFLENVDSRFLDLLGLDRFNLVTESMNEERSVLIGVNNFNEEFYFDSLIGIVSDKAFGCHIEQNQDTFSTEMVNFEGACISLIKKILNQSIH